MIARPRRSRKVHFALSIQFRWLIILALGSGRGVEACPQSREACIRLRLQISEHLPIRGFDFAKNFAKNLRHANRLLANSESVSDVSDF